MRQALLDNLPRRRAAQPLTASLPAPLGGWNTRDSIAEMPPVDATLLVNLFPRLGKVILRGGMTHSASGATGTIKSLVSYAAKSGAVKLFAVTDAGFYDMTLGGPMGAVVQALTNGYVNYINLTNAAGTTYLWSCNGTDTAKTYDGTTWATPAVTGVNSANLVFPLLHKHRIFAIEKNSMNVWYLPIDSIQGAAAVFPLGMLFRRGGNLVSLASWTLDSGNGPDDLFVAVTSEGEVAVYQGTDPASATTWSVVGVWHVGAPLGRRCFQQLAGDVLILTENGVFPLSRVLKAAKLNYTSALSNKIQSGFTDHVKAVGPTTPGWDATVYPQFDALIVNAPPVSGTKGRQFVMNTVTGAWCTFSGWEAYCFIEWDNRLFFGTTGGVVYEAWGDWVGDNSATVPIDIVGTAHQAYNYFGARTLLKQVTLFRPLLSYAGAVQENWAISPDFTEVAMNAMTPRGNAVGGHLWDTFLWDTTLWNVSISSVKLWRLAAHQPGYALALWLQFTTKNSGVEWTGTDFILAGGGAL
jgi:hypothetical protein